MSRVVFGKPTEESVRSIADTMRAADAAEVMASSGHLPLESLTNSVINSDFTTMVWIDDVPCVMFGLLRRDFTSGRGVIWMLGSHNVMKHQRELLRCTPPVIEEMLSKCSTLYNYVHDRNTASIRWLKWLGFTIEDPEPGGINGELFHYFHLSRG